MTHDAPVPPAGIPAMGGASNPPLGAVVAVINTQHRRPVTAQWLRLWLRDRQSVRFADSITATLHIHRAPPAGHDIALHYCDSDHACAVLTPYTPISLASTSGCLVVARAIACLAGAPIAVMLEVQGLDRPPLAALEAVHAC